eukprot:1161452-Pelagomonas_calceolata.AAC.2
MEKQPGTQCRCSTRISKGTYGLCSRLQAGYGAPTWHMIQKLRKPQLGSGKMSSKPIVDATREDTSSARAKRPSPFTMHVYCALYMQSTGREGVPLEG